MQFLHYICGWFLAKFIDQFFSYPWLVLTCYCPKSDTRSNFPVAQCIKRFKAWQEPPGRYTVYSLFWMISMDQFSGYLWLKRDIRSNLFAAQYNVPKVSQIYVSFHKFPTIFVCPKKKTRVLMHGEDVFQSCFRGSNYYSSHRKSFVRSSGICKLSRYPW